MRVKVRASKRVGSKNREREQPLSEKDILDAALQLIRAHGVDAFAMRGLADKLGVSPMAIYYHVPNKEELLHRVAEAVLAEVPTPTPSRDAWERQMRDHALSILELLSACPGLSRVVLSRPPVKAGQRLTSYTLSLLKAAGFDEHTALSCLLSFHTYLLGVLSVQARAQRPKRHTTRPKRPRNLPPEVRLLEARWRHLDVREWTEFGLETMLAGIRAQRAARKAKPSLDVRSA